MNSLALPYREYNMRRSGWVHYDEIILAMLYWKSEQNIVPQKQIELRKDRDDVIKFEVEVRALACARDSDKEREKWLERIARQSYQTMAKQSHLI